MVEAEQVFLKNFNGYQPARGAEHHELKGLQTSPDGIDHSEQIIGDRCYIKLATAPLGNAFNDINFNAFGTLDLEFHRILGRPMRPGEDPVEYDAKQERLRIAQAGMQEALVENGVGHSFIHTLTSDHKIVNRRILIRAGKIHFMRLSGGKPPEEYWPAETGIDYETAFLLAQEGYHIVIVAPWQIRLTKGGAADNQPARIPLRGESSIVALPFSRSLHDAISWAKDRNDPGDFADRYVVPLYNGSAPNHNSRRLNFMVTDLETLGGHDNCEGVGEMVQELIRVSLPERNILPIFLKDLDLSDLPEAELVERSSWSCEHGDLARWHGPCGCHDHEVSSRSQLEWKGPYYHAQHKLCGQVSDLITKELGWADDELVEVMGNNFFDLLTNPGGDASNTDKSVLSALASALATTTSCPTFFKSPGTSGFINMLFARQTILHLRDAGLIGASRKFWREYMRNMRRFVDPEHPTKTGADMVEDLLEGRVGRAETRRQKLPLAA